MTRRMKRAIPSSSVTAPAYRAPATMPFPFQIFQTEDQILIVYEFKGTVRTIYLNDAYPEGPAGRWRG